LIINEARRVVVTALKADRRDAQPQLPRVRRQPER